MDLDRLREFFALLIGLTIVCLVVAMAYGGGVIALNYLGEWAFPVAFFSVLVVGVSVLAFTLIPLMTKIRGW